jgi:hypothetical protein
METISFREGVGGTMIAIFLTTSIAFLVAALAFDVAFLTATFLPFGDGILTGFATFTLGATFFVTTFFTAGAAFFVGFFATIFFVAFTFEATGLVAIFFLATTFPALLEGAGAVVFFTGMVFFFVTDLFFIAVILTS